MFGLVKGNFMISLKDYSLKHNISYEAVRSQVSRYKKELTGHIIKKGRTRFLDEEGERFLDSKRAESPIVIMSETKDEHIRELESQVQALRVKVLELQDEIISRDNKLLELSDRILLLSSPSARSESDREEVPSKSASEDEHTQTNQKTSFWRRLFGL